MKRISVQLYSLRQRCAENFVQVLQDVAAMGYAGVETAGLQGRSPAEIRRICDDLGLVVSSAHVGMPTAENLNETVETAKALGYEYVISGYGPDQFRTLNAIKAAAEDAAAAAELLKPHGLKLGCHNHYWEFDLVEGRYGYSWFFEMAPNVFSELDTYWACNFGVVDVPLVVAMHKKNLPLLHIKDGPLVKGQPHTAVGAGKMNFKAVIKAAGPTTQWLVVELDECATDMTEAVRQSCRYLAKNRFGKGRKRA